MVSNSSLKPLRIVLGWQVIATAILTLLFAFAWGLHGGLSAALGGAVNLVAGGAYGFMVSKRNTSSAVDALRTIFRAEALKVLLVIVQLWLVLSYYGDIVHVAFFAAFVITVVVFAAAIAVRDTDDKNAPRITGDR